MMLRYILLEAYYRSFYVVCGACAVACFSYFIKGSQLEYFFCVFAFDYQAVEFCFYGDILLEAPLAQQGAPGDYRGPGRCWAAGAGGARLLAWVCACWGCLGGKEERGCCCGLYATGWEPARGEEGRNRMRMSPLSPLGARLSLGANEARGWLHLFVGYLSYFYCIRLGRNALHCLLWYAEFTHFCAFAGMHIFSFFAPGLLKRALFGLALALALPLAAPAGRDLALALVAGLEELRLERLDSELL